MGGKGKGWALKTLGLPLPFPKIHGPTLSAPKSAISASRPSSESSPNNLGPTLSMPNATLKLVIPALAPSSKSSSNDHGPALSVPKPAIPAPAPASASTTKGVAKKRGRKPGGVKIDPNMMNPK